MSRTAFALALGLCGCAPSLSKAVGYANKGMVALDVIADEAALLYNDAAVASVRLCAAELGSASTEEQRHDCLMKKGFAPEQIEKAEAAVEKVREAYDLIVEALEIVKQNAAAIDKLRADAKAVSK